MLPLKLKNAKKSAYKSLLGLTTSHKELASRTSELERYKQR